MMSVWEHFFFWIILVLMMMAATSSELPIAFYQSARPCAPKDLIFPQRRCENMKYDIWFQFHGRGGIFFCVRQRVYMCVSLN